MQRRFKIERIPRPMNGEAWAVREVTSSGELRGEITFSSNAQALAWAAEQMRRDAQRS